MSKTHTTTLADIRDLLAAQPTHRELHEVWNLRVPALPERKALVSRAPRANDPARVPWLEADAALVRSFVRKAAAAGAYFLAADAAREALQIYPDDTELQRGLAFALLRLGSPVDARRAFQALLPGFERAPNDHALTLQLIGDCFYYEALAAGAEELRHADLRSALAAYERAAALDPTSSAPHARAASVAALMGDGVRATRLAEAALSLVDQRGPDSDTPGPLLDAASALCVVGRTVEAADTWRKASTHPRVTVHQLAGTRAHARLLARAAGLAEFHFDACFPPLSLVVFSGHMVDLQNGENDRFPASAEVRARKLIAEAIERVQPCVAFSGAGAGSDMLFLEEYERFRQSAALERTSHVVLPWAREAFLDSSVRPYGAGWEKRFAAALSTASSVREMDEARLPEDVVGLEYGNLAMSGVARLHAQTLGLDLVPLVFWNGERGRAGGTGSFVEYWRTQGVEPTNALKPEDMAAFRTRATMSVSVAPLPSQRPSLAPSMASGRASARPAPSARSGALGRQVKTMLFADVVGYSKLPESVVPRYVEHFLGLVSRLVSESRYAPISVNTWGDAVYFVFDRAEDGGMFALELCERIQSTRWLDLGVFWEDRSVEPPEPRPLALRTALHTGPVYVHNDPVVRRLGFTGAHVSRAARIEPITPPGSVYASEEFAAIAATESVDGFLCDFVRAMPLAKNYPGDFRIYSLRRIVRFPLELVAHAVHEQYRSAEAAKGMTPGTNPSMVPWEALGATLQHENLAQAAAIKDKLHQLGYELASTASGVGVDLRLTEAQIEELAIREHERWCESRRRDGWIYGNPRDNARKHHPLLVPWNDLDHDAKEKDRDAVRNLPALLRSAGFQAV